MKVNVQQRVTNVRNTNNNEQKLTFKPSRKYDFRYFKRQFCYRICD